MVVNSIDGICFLGENIVNQRFVRRGVPDTERAFISFFKEAKSYRALKKNVLHQVEASLPEQDTSSIYVMIIGESCNRNHLSLYGYQRDTSPRLKNRNDILTFTNVITPYATTMKSVLASLMEANMDKDIPLDSCIHIFDVFHSAGFKTFWISNQSPMGVWDNAVFNLAKTADVTRFINSTANSSFESTLISSYDENLIEPLKNVIENDDSPHKFIVLHLMGSHSSYSKRYPKEFENFNKSENSCQQTIDEYDNSLLYNDFVIDSIFSLLSSFCDENPHIQVASVYCSDHGENVYDNGSDYSGHNYTDTIPNSIVEIPFLLWMSKSKKAALGNEYYFIENQIDKPYMTDDLFYLLIDLANISSPYHIAERSLINPDYNCNRIRKLSDGKRIYEKQSSIF